VKVSQLAGTGPVTRGGPPACSAPIRPATTPDSGSPTGTGWPSRCSPTMSDKTGV